jgi:hypothetical protein
MDRKERRERLKLAKNDYKKHLKSKPKEIKLDPNSDENFNFIEFKKWELRKESIENLMKKYESSKSFSEESIKQQERFESIPKENSDL